MSGAKWLRCDFAGLPTGPSDAVQGEGSHNLVLLDELEVVLEPVGRGVQALAVDERNVAHVEGEQVLAKHQPQVHDEPVEVHLAVQQRASGLCAPHHLYLGVGLPRVERWVGDSP